MAVLKIHSHPAGATRFSSFDDQSDNELLSAVGRRAGGLHMSAVMMPDGAVFARAVDSQGEFLEVERVVVVGDDIVLYDQVAGNQTREFELRHQQMFGARTTRLLAGLTVGVAGVSGTGSPVIEMLARLGIGRLVLIDDDRVETKNLNRIYGATRVDADVSRLKTEVLADHVRRMGLETEIECISSRIEHPQAIEALGGCDVVFGCMDSVEGRDTLNRIASAYIIPYFDIGVRLDADGSGGVNSVSAVVHYVQPGGSSLKSRGVYSDEDLYAEYLHRTDPMFYADQRRRGYVRGVRVDSPAVISINTAIAATAVNELLARIHPHRSRPNAEFATQRLLISHGRMTQRTDGVVDSQLLPTVGLGHCLQTFQQKAAA